MRHAVFGITAFGNDHFGEEVELELYGLVLRLSCEPSVAVAGPARASCSVETYERLEHLADDWVGVAHGVEVLGDGLLGNGLVEGPADGGDVLAVVDVAEDKKTDAETEVPIHWPPDTRTLFRKDTDAGKD